MLRKRFVQFLLIALFACMFFLLLEGLASVITVFHPSENHYPEPLAERLHTDYDPELGWINRPNLNIPDMYGKGISFKTNAQRFRNDADFGREVPPGKIRIICSGDSFTLGYGVRNSETWCERLKTLDHQVTNLNRLETVNLGQGGYGVDQAYLWYARDGIQLNHQLHIFTFILTDFIRMKSSRFEGYEKPVFVLENGALALRNVPVPKTAYHSSWGSHLVQASKNLRTMEFLQTIIRSGKRDAYEKELSDGEVLQIALKIFEKLQQLNREKNSLLVVVYLPTESDYRRKHGETFLTLLFQELNKRGVLTVDLRPSFDRLDLGQHERMFIPKGELVYPYASGHYTAAGNLFAASLIYKALLESSEARRKLALKADFYSSASQLNDLKNIVK